MASNYDVHEKIRDLEKENVITERAAKQFTSGPKRAVNIPSMDDVNGDPVFLCILTDASTSMTECVDVLIKSHPVMLDSLRESALARHNLLHVCQYLFNSDPVNLHPFVPLSTHSGNDQVTILDRSNYVPSGMTALYKTLHSCLQDLLAMVSYARSEGLSPSASIALFTDGNDTEKGVSPSEIKNLFDELHDQQILKSSVLVGLLNSGLTRSHLVSIQKELGFKDMIECGRDSARDIRRAFVMASQSAVAGLS
jgi:hypothetical protein